MDVENNPSGRPDFAPALRAQRKHRGMTQQGLAAHSNVSEAWVRRLEAGNGNPLPVVAYKLAYALHWDIAEAFPAAGLPVDSLTDAHMAMLRALVDFHAQEHLTKAA